MKRILALSSLRLIFASFVLFIYSWANAGVLRSPNGKTTDVGGVYSSSSYVYKSTSSSNCTAPFDWNANSKKRYGNMSIARNTANTIPLFYGAYDDVSVTTTEAGTLESLLLSQSPENIRSLTISGPLNAKDLIYIKSLFSGDWTHYGEWNNYEDYQMCELQSLDLSNARFVKSSYRFTGNGSDLLEFKLSEDSCFSEINVVEHNSGYYTEGAYLSCNKSLKSIALPDNIKYIGSLDGGINLENVILPESLEEIESWAFRGCGITSIYIPRNVKKIGLAIFADCVNLESINVNVYNTVFNGRANMMGCNSIIGYDGKLYAGCKNTDLSAYEFNKIGFGAFYGCEGLSKVEIPNYVKIIDAAAFLGCKNLKTVIFNEGLKGINLQAFNGCKLLTEINFPNSLDSLGSAAFWNCNIKEVSLSKNLRYYGRVLKSTLRAENIVIASYSSFFIHETGYYQYQSPFYNNPIEKITIDKENPYYQSFDDACVVETATQSLIDGFGNFTIPNSVKRLADRSLDNYSSTEIVIPKQVESIVCSNFGHYGHEINKMTILSDTPPVIEKDDYDKLNNYDRIYYPTFDIYVHAWSIGKYKAADGWKEVTNILPIENTDTYTVTLDHHKGNGDPEQITVTYNQPMPENIGLEVPTRKGYDFTGYSRNEKYYYDANLKSVRNFDKQEDYTLYANWKARTTTVTLNPQGGQSGTAQITATYAKAMPTGEDIVAPTRAGYTFEGYYTSKNGNGTQYYNADMTSTCSWYRDASTATLYAYWNPKTIPVASIALSETEAILWIGKAKTITATVNPTDASNTTVTWSSSNTQVATVTTKGVIKAIGKGTCIITCMAADGYGTKAECEVTVKQQVTSINFGYETLSVTCGTTKTLKPKIYPSNADVQTLTWKSKNTSVAKVSSEGVLTAVVPGTAQIISTATDGFWKADTITVEVVPLKITDSKPTIADGTYGAGGISYTRTLTEGKYAAFCLPYNVNLNDYTEEFSKVFVPMGMTFLKTNGTLMVIFKNVSMTETIRAGKPFVALAAKSGSVSIVNDAKKTFTDLISPTPTDLDVYNWNGSNGFLTLNPDITVQMGGTYSKLTGLDSEKYYMVSTGGSIGKATSISPYRIFIYKDDNNSNAKVTEIIFSFDEDEMATGVEDIRNEQKGDGKYYNLNGQRINKSNAQKGIYIINGKKVVVK